MKGGFGRPFFLLRPPECLADTADHHADGLYVALPGLISYTSRLFSAGNRPATIPSVEL